jgi:hypothetical protein
MKEWLRDEAKIFGGILFCALLILAYATLLNSCGLLQL